MATAPNPSEDPESWDKSIVGRPVDWHVLVYYGNSTCRFIIGAATRLNIMVLYEKFCQETEEKNLIKHSLRVAVRESIVDNLHVSYDTEAQTEAKTA